MTIIVPVLNGEDVLPRTMGAVLSQPVDRIVYVNDGSTDSTSQILSDLASGDERVEVVTMPGNCGRAAARNAGATGARGLLYFLDADVAPANGYVRAMAAAMALPGAVAAVGALRFPETDPSEPYHRYLASSRRGVGASSPVEAIQWRFFLAGVAVLDSETFHQLGGFPESIRYGEDLALACRLAGHSPTGLRHAPEAEADLYDLGTLDTALAKLAGFARDLGAVSATCPDALKVAGFERLASTSVRDRVAMTLAKWPAPAAAFRSIAGRLPASLQPLAVRYLLGHTLVANARLDDLARTS